MSVEDYCKHYRRRYRIDRSAETCEICDEVDAARIDAAKKVRDWCDDHPYERLEDAAMAAIVGVRLPPEEETTR
jgi:hypothetical protein